MILFKLKSDQGPCRAQKLPTAHITQDKSSPHDRPQFPGSDPVTSLTATMTAVLLLGRPKPNSPSPPGLTSRCSSHCLEHTPADAQMLPAPPSSGSPLTSQRGDGSPDCHPPAPSCFFSLRSPHHHQAHSHSPFINLLPADLSGRKARPGQEF